MLHIFILEDDRDLAGGIERALREPDRAFTCCCDMASARRVLAQNQFDLLILDVTLPDGSGLDLCAEVRAFLSTPILFLTANDTEMDMVYGLEIGGDDYITKPFSLAVLRARVSALLRRGKKCPQTLTFGALTLDFERIIFSKNGERMELSKTEQRLLHLLVTHPGQTLTRDRLMAYVWPDGDEFVDENALSVAISRLRTKLEDDPSTPQHIRTVRGIGYSWAVTL